MDIKLPPIQTQLELTGIMDRPDPFEVERFRIAQQALGPATVAELQEHGRAFSYDQALQSVRAFLTTS